MVNGTFRPCLSISPKPFTAFTHGVAPLAKRTLGVLYFSHRQLRSKSANINPENRIFRIFRQDSCIRREKRAFGCTNILALISSQQYLGTRYERYSYLCCQSRFLSSSTIVFVHNLAQGVDRRLCQGEGEKRSLERQAFVQVSR